MKAIVITEPGRVELTTIDDPTPEPVQVVVAVAACGICGTDLHLVDGDVAARYPLVPGHEFAGEVVAVGRDVTGLSLGDRVAVDPNQPCGTCRLCRRGRANLCENYAAVGVTMAGAAADYVAVPVDTCVRLPSTVDIGDAALIEPLACAVRGFDVLDLLAGDQVLIYGAGTMGLLNLALAPRAGAGSIDVVDPNADRLATALRLGASRVATTAADLSQTGGWDAVIDCTGVIAAIEDGLGRVAKGGTFLQFGVAPQDATASWSPFRTYRDEIRIAGSMAILDSFDRAAALLADGVLDPAAIITDRLPLAEYPEALARLRAGKGHKQLVVP